MTPEQIQLVAEVAAEVAVRKMGDGNRHHCACKIDVLQHDQEHVFIRRAIKTLDKIDAIRWGVLKAVAIAAAFVIIGVFGWRLK